MAAPTLATLRTAFYNRFDEGSQNYIGIPEANALINEGAEHLYNWLISTGENYVFTELQGTLSPTVTDFALPADFFKLLKVFVVNGGIYTPIPRLMLDEWTGSFGRFGYILIDGYLRFSQSVSRPTATISMWYAPTYTRLVNDTDAFSFQYIPGSAEFIINQAVIAARIKEESDTTPLERRQAQITQMIETDFANRDMGRRQHVVDAEQNRVAPWPY